MNQIVRTLALVLTGAAAACAGFDIEDSEGCPEICATAYTCGFLPSALGFDPDTALATADCERRCQHTPHDDPQFTLLRDCLGGDLELPDDVMPWCDDSDDPAYADGVMCSAAATCLVRSFEGSMLVSDVTLNVRLISYADFTMYFSADALTGLYTHDPTTTTSCALALCGEDDCKRREDEHPPPCDASMCGKGMGQTAQICDDLAAHTVELLVQERNAPPAVQVLLDETSEQGCSTPAKDFGSEMYLLHPGPVQTYARITGELTADVLRTIDYPVADDVPGDMLVDYCLLFPGMNLNVRGGENVALVPVATVADIAATALRPVVCD
jgi:hypothetical protein